MILQMAPAELENVILSHPDVQDVAVIGIPHEEDGAWPMGVIVLKPGAISSERDILDFVNSMLRSLLLSIVIVINVSVICRSCY